MFLTYSGEYNLLAQVKFSLISGISGVSKVELAKVKRVSEYKLVIYFKQLGNCFSFFECFTQWFMFVFTENVLFCFVFDWPIIGIGCTQSVILCVHPMLWWL